jgi:hypothetical protein
VYRRSLSSSLNQKRPKLLSKIQTSQIETRKDSAVHVSLSSSSLVKQPEAHSLNFPEGRSLKIPLDGKSQPMTIGCHCTHLSEELTGTETGQGQRPRRRRAQWAVYKPGSDALSTPVVRKSSHQAKNQPALEVPVPAGFAP